MTKLTEFQRKQLDQISRATDIEVNDLLKVVMDDIEKGDVKVDGVLVITVVRKGNDEDFMDSSRYRAGLTYSQTIALLEMTKQHVLEQWRSK